MGDAATDLTGDVNGVPRGRRSSVMALLEPHLEAARRRSVAEVEIERKQRDTSSSSGEKRDVPVWWMFVVSSYCIPLGITNTLIGQILLPPLIQQCVGNESKQAALGLASSICSAIHTVEPFLGVISDRCTWRFRRRAFVVIGQSFIVIGVGGFFLANRTHHYGTLLGAYFIFHVGCMVGWVPYIAVIPEFPAHQRALGASVIAFTCGACEYIGAMLGIAVGRRWISAELTYIMMMALNVLNILLGCLSMGDSPGWLTAERPAPPLSKEDTDKSCYAIVRSRLCAPDRFKSMCNYLPLSHFYSCSTVAIFAQYIYIYIDSSRSGQCSLCCSLELCCLGGLTGIMYARCII